METLAYQYNDEELAQKGELERSRREYAIEEDTENEEAIDTPQTTELRISLIGGSLFAAAIFLFFDAPQYITDILLFGYGFIVNWIIAAFGWLTIYIWLKSNGYSIFMGKRNSWKMVLGFAVADMLPAIPGLSGFVITFVLKERARNIPGVGKLVKKAT